MMRINIPIMLLGLLISTAQQSKALEFLITDVNGTAYNTTTNKLDLGENPTAKTVYVWMTYDTSEKTTINNGGGLASGSARLTFANFNYTTFPTSGAALVPYILKPSSTSLGGTNWSAFQRGSTSPYAQAVFSSGAGGGITLTDPTKVLLAAFVISPGSQLSYVGTTVTIGLAGAANGFTYGDGFSFTPITLTNAGTLQFTVVPEASTIAMGLVSVVSLVSTGLYRRRVAKNTKSAL